MQVSGPRPRRYSAYSTGQARTSIQPQFVPPSFQISSVGRPLGLTPGETNWRLVQTSACVVGSPVRTQTAWVLRLTYRARFGTAESHCGATVPHGVRLL